MALCKKITEDREILVSRGKHLIWWFLLLCIISLLSLLIGMQQEKSVYMSYLNTHMSYVGTLSLKKRLCATDLCLVFNLHILNFRVQIVFLLLIRANNYGLHIISIRSSAVPDVSEQSIKNWMTQRSEGNTWIKKKSKLISSLVLVFKQKIIPCVGIFVCFSFFF